MYEEESSKKDALIEQLRNENQELEEKCAENTLLRAQIADLSHKVTILEEEKARIESSLEQSLSQRSPELSSLETKVKTHTEELGKKEESLRDTEAELAAYSQLLEEKDDAILTLEKSISTLFQQNRGAAREFTKKQQGIEDARYINDQIQSEIDRINEFNESLTKRQAETKEKEDQIRQEIEEMKGTLSEVETQVEAGKEENQALSNELDIAREGRKTNQRELTQQLKFYNELMAEKRRLELRTQEMIMETKRIERGMENARVVIDERENEIKTASKGYETVETKKLQKENEILRMLLDKYKEDAILCKKIRESESIRKVEIEEEKRRAELDAMHKEMLARSARKELEKVKGEHDYLADSRYLIDRELDTIKEHAEVLESQNKELHRELDRFVETDERVRWDLDKKNEVEYVKAKHKQDYERSAAKVRNSLSPEKRTSPYRSPYH